MENSKQLLSSMKDVIILLQSSNMDEDEKKMWLAIMPYMDELQVKHLSSILRTESDIYIDAYLNSL